LETRCGTLHYVAPEVLSKTPYNHKCDFWSLGVVLYVLLCGYLPFYHEERSITVQLVRQGRFAFDDEEWADVSNEAKDLIQQLLEIDPEKRLGAKEILAHPFLNDHFAKSARAQKAFSQQHKERIESQQNLIKKENAQLLCAVAKARIDLRRWVNCAKKTSWSTKT